jgi:pimeloyl-ACP methyl ester carboxylesterase
MTESLFMTVNATRRALLTGAVAGSALGAIPSTRQAEVPTSGHFAAWEQPELFTAELRAAFRPLR